ncbi:hypothetical protein F4777DRAFT_467183 [Nemania sp. FL0916]|nr:hypothetical protein F4777DRAFT_467183 [Nemania sp. FL0916]
MSQSTVHTRLSQLTVALRMACAEVHANLRIWRDSGSQSHMQALRSSTERLTTCVPPSFGSELSNRRGSRPISRIQPALALDNLTHVPLQWVALKTRSGGFIMHGALLNVDVQCAQLQVKLAEHQVLKDRGEPGIPSAIRSIIRVLIDIANYNTRFL